MQEQAKCYIKEAGKPCEFSADYTCERCRRPICDVHMRDIQGFFVDRRIPYCIPCYEQHNREQEEY